MDRLLSEIERTADATVSAPMRIWVPSEFIVVHRVAVPTAPKRKWPGLLPWLLEERLLEDPESQHFVPVGKDAGELCVIVVSSALMQEWQDRISAAGIARYSLYPDFLALPWRSGAVSIGRRDGKILLRTGEFEGTAAEPDLAWHLLGSLLRQKENTPGIMLCMEDDALPAQFAEHIVSRQSGIDLGAASPPAGANLLVGKFSLRPAFRFTRRWLQTAALLIIGLGLSYVALSLDNKQLAATITAQQDVNRDAFYRLFPGVSVRSGDLRATMNAYLDDRFRQRDSLEGGGMAMLMALDPLLSGCACELLGLKLENGSARLRLSDTAQSELAGASLPGYRLQFSAPEDTPEQVQLEVSPERHL